MRRSPSYRFGIVSLLACVGTAHAIQTCELDGRPVNPNNGATTEGKSGLMRCRDADSGAIVREQQLQNGRFMGAVRLFKAGQVEKEHTVNERGNVDGVAREWNVDEASGRRVLVREETRRNATTVGIARTWTATGKPRRLTFHGDDGREQASVEFDDEGRVADLRCASRPVFGNDFDDRIACGFAGRPMTTVLYGRGRPSSRVTYEDGERRRSETLDETGTVRDVRESTPSGGFERRFAADGTLRREVRWAAVAAKDATSPRRVDTLEQEHHESGKLVHERRWTPTERGGELASETWWYLNGQTRSQDRYESDAGARMRRETTYFDDGRVATEGSWRLAERRGDRYGTPVGTHRAFDAAGRPSVETTYDDRGRLVREKSYEDGRLVRDDEVYEDGSRKSVGR